MGQIKITTDSSCSIPMNLLNKYNVDVIYLEIQVEDSRFLDCLEITGSNLFEYHNQTGKFAEALPVPTEAYLPFFGQFFGEYDHIIHIGSSVGSKRSYDNARLAAKDCPGVTVADAGQVSGGLALMVLQAADMAMKGASRDDILAEFERRRSKVYASFIIGTMEYFYQSERCSNLTRHLTRLFHLRPGISVIDGRMSAYKMYHGGDEPIREAFIADFLSHIQQMERDIVILANSGCTARFMESLYSEVAACAYFDKILTIQDSAAISSHCGPNTFGMYCVSREKLKERRRHENFGVSRGRRHP